MNPGKITCDILKKIRSEIAEANLIEYRTDPCTFKGECLGTCPKCEAELIELEHQLAKKQRFPKKALIAGVTLSILSEVATCQTKQIPIIQIVNTETKDTVFTQKVDTANIVTNFVNIESYQKYGNTNEFQLSGVCPNPMIIPTGTNISCSESSTTNISCNPSYNYHNETVEMYLNKQFIFPKNKIVEKTLFSVKLFLDKNGKIQYVLTIQSIEPEIDQQIIEIIKYMPEWNPKRDSKGNNVEAQVFLTLKVTQNGITVKKLTYDEVKKNK